jgi:hypothetical protein
VPDKRVSAEIIEIRKNICNALKELQKNNEHVTADMLSAYLTQFHKTDQYTLATLGNNLKRLSDLGAVRSEKYYNPSTQARKTIWFVVNETYEDPLIIRRLIILPKKLYEDTRILAKSRGKSINTQFVEWLTWCSENPEKVG